MTKIDRATVLALALASLLVRGGERIALLGDGHGPPTGRAPLRRIGHALIDLAPTTRHCRRDAPVTKNAQFVWFSDFLSPLAEIETAMRSWRQMGLTGHLVHIIDPAEEDFPFTGRTRFEMPDARAKSSAAPRPCKAPIAARFKAHAETLAALARRLGWSYLAHRTDNAPRPRWSRSTPTFGAHAKKRAPRGGRWLFSPASSFGAPWILAALLVLPAIWWLLRVTPPSPRRVIVSAAAFAARIVWAGGNAGAHAAGGCCCCGCSRLLSSSWRWPSRASARR